MAPILIKKTNLHFSLFSEKFINLLMIDGKKLKASKLFFDMLLLIKKRIEKNSSNLVQKEYFNISVLQVLAQAVENVTPSLEVRKVRVAGTTYLVPAILSKKRQETLAIRWMIESAKKRKKNLKFNFSECLADEIYEASKKQGNARQKRDDLHRLAEANRAYIRYRWW
jgi:small subunit ribosomal protein S7